MNANNQHTFAKRIALVALWATFASFAGCAADVAESNTEVDEKALQSAKGCTVLPLTPNVLLQFPKANAEYSAQISAARSIKNYRADSYIGLCKGTNAGQFFKEHSDKEILCGTMYNFQQGYRRSIDGSYACAVYSLPIFIDLSTPT